MQARRLHRPPGGRAFGTLANCGAATFPAQPASARIGEAICVLYAECRWRDLVEFGSCRAHGDRHDWPVKSI
ncbi:hypothetical protein BIWAKO_02389 [Bosea sp. BIWAKO-01]|nr:hypothetical protein BIWAKO_02389 [Bosea sp. BIWAKO-01]